MEQLFGAIPMVLSGLVPNAEIDEAVVFAAWSRCAGELLRKRAAPLKFIEKVLVVAVQDKTWQRHLEELSPQMLQKINGFLGQKTVQFVEFRISSDAVEASEDRLSRTVDVVRDPPAVAPSLLVAANVIADEHLRKQFLGAAATCLAKQKP